MIRLLGFIIKIALLVGAVLWLSSQPGHLTMEWFGYEISTTAAFLAIAIFLLVAAALTIARFLRWLSHGPKLWSKQQQINKLEKGHAKLGECLAALAAGNMLEAGRKAVAARKLLGRTPSTLFLQAQAAGLARDDASAAPLFRELTQHQATSMLGWRGLITTALKNERYDEATTLLTEALRQNPQAAWLNSLRIALAARRGQWVEAEQAVMQALEQRALFHGPDSRIQQAAIHLAQAQDALRQKQFDDALRHTAQALRLQPQWLPALLEQAHAEWQSGRGKAAERSISRAWRSQPHPEFALIWKQLHGEETSLDQFKAFETLARQNPDHFLSHLVLAEAALRANLWGEAKRHLELLAARDPDRQVYRLLALVAQAEQEQPHADPLAAHRWLAKAADAAPEASWLCRSCGGASARWQASCPHCHDFVTLDWGRPGQSRKQKPAALPVLRDTGTA